MNVTALFSLIHSITLPLPLPLPLSLLKCDFYNRSCSLRNMAFMHIHHGTHRIDRRHLHYKKSVTFLHCSFLVNVWHLRKTISFESHNIFFSFNNSLAFALTIISKHDTFFMIVMCFDDDNLWPWQSSHFCLKPCRYAPNSEDSWKKINSEQTFHFQIHMANRKTAVI